MRATDLDNREVPSFESKGVLRFSGDQARLPDAAVLRLPNRILPAEIHPARFHQDLSLGLGNVGLRTPPLPAR